MPKETSLKDKIDGNLLDLSLNSLSVIPVNELALLPKATHLDLSCNILTKLPEDFCTLQHIVHLDLSKNKLLELPRNFGELRKLQHLDLLGNELSTLPVSFCHLKNLKWLDLKDNPLKEPLKSLVGDCLDEKQCKACAKNVLEFMKKVQAEQEKQFQKKLLEEREKEEQRKAEENTEKQRIKEERKREKDKRRREHEERLAQKNAQQREVEKETSEVITEGGLEGKRKIVKDRTAGGVSCCGVLLAVVIGIIAVCVGLYFYCSSHTKDQACHEIKTFLNIYWREAHRLIETYTKK